MVLLDVNVLVFAHREDSPNHTHYVSWLEDLINSDQTYGLSDHVLSRFLRVVTHPKVFIQPSSMERALTFVQELRSQPNCTVITPGPRHWEIFIKLCRTSDVKGNLVPETFLAALAIESGSEWVTADRNYHRFSGLKIRHIL